MFKVTRYLGSNLTKNHRIILQSFMLGLFSIGFWFSEDLIRSQDLLLISAVGSKELYCLQCIWVPPWFPFISSLLNVWYTFSVVVLYKTFTTTGISILPSAFTLPALFAFLKLSPPDQILDYQPFAPGFVAIKLVLFFSVGKVFLKVTLVEPRLEVFFLVLF